jgi:hypothetical protein
MTSRCSGRRAACKSFASACGMTRLPAPHTSEKWYINDHSITRCARPRPCRLRYAPLADVPWSHLTDGSTTVRASFFLVEDGAISIMASGGERDVQVFGVLARAGAEGEGDEDEVMLVVHVLVAWEGGPGAGGRLAMHRCIDEQLARSRAIAQHGFTD